jgi:hypothetical protein
MMLLVIVLAVLAALVAGALWLYHKVTQLEKRCTVGVGLAADHRNDLARLETRVEEVAEQVVDMIKMAMDDAAEDLAEPVCTLMFCEPQRPSAVVEEMPDSAEPASAPDAHTDAPPDP